MKKFNGNGNGEILSETKLIPIEDLDQHPHEQELRLTESAIAGLMHDITMSRYIAPLIVMWWRGKYVVIDGNRRLKVANTLNKLGKATFDKLKCEVLPAGGDIDVLFARLNAHLRNQSGKDRLQFIAKLDPSKWDAILKEWTSSFAHKFRQLRKAVGDTELVKMGLEGDYGPDIMNRTNAAQANFTRCGVIVSDAAIIRWMMKHQSQNVVNILVRQPGGMTRQQVTKLAKAITNDVPLRLKHLPMTATTKKEPSARLRMVRAE